MTSLNTILAPLQWQPASWKDYLRYRDRSSEQRMRLYFNGEAVLVDMGSEGIDHASPSDLFLLLIYIWVSRHQPELTVSSFGRCLLEKPDYRAASPDLVVYLGEGIPQRQGELRRISLDQWRVPDLVGEISDTTLASDLDEKKKLYADLQIPEYWVIDVQGKRVLAFRLQDGHYRQCIQSVAFTGLSIALLDQALLRLGYQTNFEVANWFSQQIAS
jgi:Uma2 family endonuclease